MKRDLRLRNSVEQLTTHVANVVVAFVILLITAPLLLFVALAIRWESPGPVLDRHPSLNRDGRRFEELNFRTSAQGRWARNMTRVGWWLMYTRIVSLPQLINVIRGDITLVEMHDDSSSFWA
jgi:lipopolysaccharide/colanic/teichoic acid biosynthesis glycosyltransferase